jgi:hypothetical protein
VGGVGVRGGDGWVRMALVWIAWAGAGSSASQRGLQRRSRGGRTSPPFSPSDAAAETKKFLLPVVWCTCGTGGRGQGMRGWGPSRRTSRQAATAATRRSRRRQAAELTAGSHQAPARHRNALEAMWSCTRPLPCTGAAAREVCRVTSRLGTVAKALAAPAAGPSRRVDMASTLWPEARRVRALRSMVIRFAAPFTI